MDIAACPTWQPPRYQYTPLQNRFTLCIQ